MMSSQSTLNGLTNASGNQQDDQNNPNNNNNDDNNNNTEDLNTKSKRTHNALKQRVLKQFVNDKGDPIAAANESPTPGAQTFEEFITAKTNQKYEYYDKNKTFYQKNDTTLKGRTQREVNGVNVYHISKLICDRIDQQYVTADGEIPDNSNPNMLPVLTYSQWKKRLRKKTEEAATNETDSDKSKRKASERLKPGRKKQKTTAADAVEQTMDREENDPMDIEIAEILATGIPTTTTTTTTTTSTNRTEQAEQGNNNNEAPADDPTAISNYLYEKVKKLPVDSNGKPISSSPIPDALTLESFIEQKKAQGFNYCDGKCKNFYTEVVSKGKKIATPEGKPAYTLFRIIQKRAKEQYVYTSNGRPVHSDKLPPGYGYKISTDLDGVAICKFNSYLTRYYDSKRTNASRDVAIDALLSLPETSTNTTTTSTTSTTSTTLTAPDSATTTAPTNATTTTTSTAPITTSTTTTTTTAPETISMENERDEVEEIDEVEEVDSNQDVTHPEIYTKLLQQVKAQKVDSLGNPIPASQESLHPDAKTLQEFLNDLTNKGYYTNASGKNFYTSNDVKCWDIQNFTTLDGETKLYTLGRVTKQRVIRQWVYAEDGKPVPLQELPDNHHTAFLKSDIKGKRISRFYCWTRKVRTNSRQRLELDTAYQPGNRTEISIKLTKQVMEQKVNAFGKPIPTSQESDHPNALTLDQFLRNLKNRGYIYTDSKGEDFYRPDQVTMVNGKPFYGETQLYTLSRVCKQRRTLQWVYANSGQPVPFQDLPDNHHTEFLHVDNSGQQICRFYTWDYSNRKGKKKDQISNQITSNQVSNQLTSNQVTYNQVSNQVTSNQVTSNQVTSNQITSNQVSNQVTSNQVTSTSTQGRHAMQNVQLNAPINATTAPINATTAPINATTAPINATTAPINATTATTAPTTTTTTTTTTSTHATTATNATSTLSQARARLYPGEIVAMSRLDNLLRVADFSMFRRGGNAQGTPITNNQTTPVAPVETINRREGEERDADGKHAETNVKDSGYGRKS